MASITSNKIIDQATTASVSGVVNVENNKSHSFHAISKGAAGAHATALVFNIEGSLDGTNWALLSAVTASGAQLTADNTFATIINTPISKIRVTVTTLTFAVSGTLDLYYLGN